MHIYIDGNKALREHMKKINEKKNTNTVDIEERIKQEITIFDRISIAIFGFLPVFVLVSFHMFGLLVLFEGLIYDFEIITSNRVLWFFTYMLVLVVFIVLNLLYIVYRSKKVEKKLEKVLDKKQKHSIL